jgi:hypothetical protein
MLCEVIANTLDEVSFIAGTNQRIYFTVSDSASAIVDLTASVCYWSMSPAGDLSYTAASAVGHPVSGSPEIYYVDLVPSDTTGLSGIFIQQPKIIDFLGNVFIPDQGKIVIWLDVGGQDMLNIVNDYIYYYYFTVGKIKIGTSRISGV